MTTRSRCTTILLACMVALSMTAAGPVVVADDGPTQTIETLENGEALYLSFGADLGDLSLEEYVEAHANGDVDDPDVEVIQYHDVDQVNVHERGEAVSVAIGGGEATAIQEVDQQNVNLQEGEASAMNRVTHDHATTFEDVGDAYVVLGERDDMQFDGWGIVGDDATVTQTAESAVAQAQAVEQANVNRGTTAFAFAEDESTATAIQLTEQSNLNLQEGSASATNVYVDDLADLENAKDDRKSGDGDTTSGVQSADVAVQQAQEVEQVNVDEQGSAVAIAVGEGASATAVQITDQSNVNQQLGTAEAINVMMESAGMNVATASIDGGNDVVTVDGATYDEPKDKKGDEAGPAEYGGVSQTTDASVTQYQSIEQANVNLNSSAEAIATGGSEAEAVQLSLQQNINAQVASAEALTVFLEEADESYTEKGAEKLDEYEGVLLTNTTTATIDGDTVADADRTTFDYDGDNDQLNDVDQYSTAEVAQSQNVSQANLHTNTALAVAEDGGSAHAFQLTIQENENVQTASAESVTLDESSTDGSTDPAAGAGSVDDADGSDDDDAVDDATDDDGDTVEPSGQESNEDEESDESLPGFGIAVALVAVLATAMLALRAQH